MQWFVKINSGEGVLLVTGSYSFQTGKFSPTQATLYLPKLVQKAPNIVFLFSDL